MSAMTPVVKVWIPIHLALLAVAYAWLFQQSALDLSIAIGLWFFLPMGVVGAIIANATESGQRASSRRCNDPALKPAPPPRLGGGV